MDDEFKRLSANKTWDITTVLPRKVVADQARKRGENVHLGRVFGICSIKGSELPPGHRDRKHKGRYVYDGRPGATRDESGAAALFQDKGSSPATIESSKLVDWYG